MDIRKYFGVGNKKTTSGAKAETSKVAIKKDEKTKETAGSNLRIRKRPSLFIDSDSDEDPVPVKKSATIASKKPAVTIEDSDDDTIRVTRSTSPKKKRPVVISPVAARRKIEKTPPKTKPVSADDYFGTAPVRRSNRTPQKKDENGNTPKKINKEAYAIRDGGKDTTDNFDTSPVRRSARTSQNKDENQNTANKSNNEDYEIHDDDDFKETLKCLDKAANASPVSQNTKSKVSLAGKFASKLASTENSTATVKKKPESKINIKSSTKARTPSPQKKPIPATQSSGKKLTPPSLEKKPSYYQHYLHREGPRALGSKEIPEGADSCLEGLSFVITGVLDSLERDEATEIIKKYGGKVMQSVSKNTKYMVVGNDAGPAKLEKANSLKIKQIDEDGLLDLIRTLPGKGRSARKSPAKSPKVSKAVTPKSTMKEATRTAKTPEKVNKSASPSVSKLPLAVCSLPSTSSVVKPAKDFSSSLWVDKYKPSNTKQIIGQHGDKSNAKKLTQWLANWHKSNSGKTKKGGYGKWKADDGSNFKAALLSGPPGVGKTTTAQLVCKEAGFTFIEMNASDTRSKRNLQEVVSQLLQNKSLSHYLEGSSECAEKHCLLMDEVDGMAGNEDRGGVQELIQLIKHSKIPIICMCNDRMHQKIRSLANYCFDLRFQRPRVEQLKAAMMTICFKEGIEMPPNAMQEIILGANQDVRQVIHHLSMWSVNKKKFTNEDASTEAKKAKKDLKIGPFDVLRMVFSSSEHKTMNFHDKSNLFFHDYSLAPLFVQENYLFVQPSNSQLSDCLSNTTKHLELLSKAADSICDGDLVDKLIRSEGHWGLLPVQAVYASVIPGDTLEGHLSQMIAFPSWLGRNSTRGKNDRLLQELHMHMRMKISGNKTDLNCDYLQYLRNAIVNPLVTREQEGIPDTVATMNEYYLMREDMDSIFDVSLWPNQPNPFGKLSAPLKAAFTRAFNKEHHLNPYAAVMTTAAKGSRNAVESEDISLNDGDLIEVDEEEEEDITKDAMIKKKTAPKRKVKDQDESQSTSKRRKGAQRGKGKK